MYTKELFSTLIIILSTVNGDNRSVCDLRDKIELNCCCNKLNTTSMSIDCDVSDKVSEITPATLLLFRNVKENITEFYLRGNIMIITVSMMELFNQMTELRTIQFLNTKITKIPENTFSKQKKISELFLSFNRIEVINENTVSALPLLKTLSLSNNNVKTISVNAFIQLPQLLELHLHSNKLTVLPAHIFDELKNLKILTLHNNSLVKFEREILLPIIMNFYHPDSRLWLQVNQLQCDCNITWLFDLYRWTTSKSIRFYLKNLYCYTSANLMGVIKLKLFDYNEEEFCQRIIYRYF